MILVTHALPDVRELAERLVLLDRGRVVGEGTVEELLDSDAEGVVRDLVHGAELG
jgi:ABC-type methionine transport system ATPase subunit